MQFEYYFLQIFRFYPDTSRSVLVVDSPVKLDSIPTTTLDKIKIPEQPESSNEEPGIGSIDSEPAPKPPVDLSDSRGLLMYREGVKTYTVDIVDMSKGNFQTGVHPVSVVDGTSMMRYYNVPGVGVFKEPLNIGVVPGIRIGEW